jgi:hypothetical protein
MAETKRMTAEQVVSCLLEEDGLDFLRESPLPASGLTLFRRPRARSLPHGPAHVVSPMPLTEPGRR